MSDSDSDSDRDGRTIPAERVETTFEFDQAQAAASITAALQTAVVDPDITPPRSDDWSLQSRAEHDAAAQINAQEQVQNRSDSDSPPSQDPLRRRGSTSEPGDALANTSLALPASGPSSIQLPPSRSATAEHDRTLQEQNELEERSRVAMAQAARRSELARVRTERGDELDAHRAGLQRLEREFDRRTAEFE